MSYCRCSTDNSDLYVYHNAFHYVIQVAYSVGLSKDGNSYKAETPQECLDKMVALGKLGYKIYQPAIDRLTKEL